MLYEELSGTVIGAAMEVHKPGGGRIRNDRAMTGINVGKRFTSVSPLHYVSVPREAGNLKRFPACKLGRVRN